MPNEQDRAEKPMPLGPWDVSDIDVSAEKRLDLGGLLLAIPDGVEVQVQADQANGRITALTLRDGDSGLQIQPYAARKSGGMWAEVRDQLKTTINTSGGMVEEAQGLFGIELRARVKNQEQGQQLQPVRFVGVDGPRWFIRGVFMGKAATDNLAAERLTSVFSSAVVVRGEAAMAPGAPIVLQLPQKQADGPHTTGTPSPPNPSPPNPSPSNPFERGPEMTEIR